MLYTTSLSNQGWKLIAEIFAYFGYTDSGRKHSLRLIVDAILYVVDNGVKWRNLPNDFPPWQTVYYHFSKWSKEGLWENVNLNLVELTRLSENRNKSPSLVSVDSLVSGR